MRGKAASSGPRSKEGTRTYRSTGIESAGRRQPHRGDPGELLPAERGRESWVVAGLVSENPGLPSVAEVARLAELPGAAGARVPERDLLAMLAAERRPPPDRRAVLCRAFPANREELGSAFDPDLGRPASEPAGAGPPGRASWRP